MRVGTVGLGRPARTKALLLASLPAAALLPGQALADAPSSTLPWVITSGNVACTTGSSVTCTTEVSSVTPLPVSVNVSNGQDAASPQTNPLVGTITGSGGTSSPSSFLFFYGGFGQPPNDTFPSLAYVQGPPVSLTSSADLFLSNAIAAGVGLTNTGTINDGLTYTYAAQGGGALVAYSRGGDGFADQVKSPDVGNFNGAQGGPVTLVNDGGASLTVAGSGAGLPWLSGLGAYSIGGTGEEDKTGDTDYAGTGGAGGAVNVTNDGSICMSNAGDVQTNGIYGFSQGGIGSTAHEGYAYGGAGDGGQVVITNSGSIANSAPKGVGIVAISLGGASDDYTKGSSDYASAAGNGGTVQVEVEDGGSIAMSGDTGIGIMALSSGGQANDGSEGAGGAVDVTVDKGGSVDTTGSGQSLSIGILAASAGSITDLLPFGASDVSTAWPGTPGSVTVTNDGKVSSAGSMAIGIAALSVGGASIVTNATAGGTSTLGTVATDYGLFDGAGASVTNTGTITTLGDAAFGIVAMSVGGGGGLLNLESADQVAYVGSATSGTGGGAGGTVTITSSGSITTGDGNGGGEAAIGIVAQSIGGGGGSSSAPAFFVGGNDTEGSGGGAGGSVTVMTQSGSLTKTMDKGALGILAQSIGGGGGNGANASGIFVATGGNGGNGGAGGAVTVDLDNAGVGGITTLGDFAAGVIAQSVGGGGGHGGYADTDGLFFSAAIGGSGGKGGEGGTVEVSNVSTIQTVGNQSLGVLAQSVGGGGGSGGAAIANSVGVGISVSLAVGGAGGSGGDGEAVTVTNDYHILTGCPASSSGCTLTNAGGPHVDGADSIGILAQSIGGGGGSGGSATAKSLALPTEEIPSVSFDFTLGGKGGDGGGGNGVTVANAGQVYTGGDGSHGIIGQSIGGGGGNGGDSTASAYAIEGTAGTLKLSMALGGAAGSGGSGGVVGITNGQSSSCSGCNGQVATYGQNATGILAQSIGGGGGTGGLGNAGASSPNLGDDTGKAIDVTVAVGGSGGNAGDGGAVTVTNDAGSSVTTVGSGSQAVLAQSIGGGGGTAGGGSAAASGDTFQGNLSIGGSGGSGNDGGSVTVTNDGIIATGALLQVGDVTFTTGGDAVGILAQSIGAGGGVGGSSDAAATIGAAGQIEDALNAPSNSYGVDLGIGGRGGAGGSGGQVQVTHGGSISTMGIRAYGIEAQSIGAGGGNGGAATSSSNSVLGGPGTDDDGNAKSGTYTADVSVGGSGGASGNGDTVKLTSSGTIQSSGYGAHAILAQSIGGGGGVGAEGTVDNTTTLGLGAGVSGGSGAGGTGGTVTIDQTGSIRTAGDDAYAILAQSIGGGGGVASAGCTNSGSASAQGVSATACLGNVGATSGDSLWNDSSDFTLLMGGSAGSSGNGDAVAINHDDGAITTYGARSFGIVAQSIGGGGGIAAGNGLNLGATQLQVRPGQNIGKGGDVAVTVASGASVTTHGDGAWGILAQSIGGGGGFVGDPSLAFQLPASNTLPDKPNGANLYPDSGQVKVTLGGDIRTSGANAHGVVAQAVGGGGGMAAGGNNSRASAVVAGNSAQIYGITSGITYAGEAMAVTVNQTGGSIEASGAGSIGIVAHASGNSNRQQPITITVGGTVTGGTGDGAAGIVMSGGGSSLTDTTRLANTVTVDAGASVSTGDGAAGVAIQAGYGLTQLSNSGTVTGSIELGSLTSYGASPPAAAAAPAIGARHLAIEAAPELATGTIVNTGTIIAGPVLVASTLTNSGVLDVGDSGKDVPTELIGDLVQTGQGRLLVTVDSLATEPDAFTVSGDAALAGQVVPRSNRLLPGTYQVLSVGGQFTPAAEDGSRSLLVDWGMTGSGNGLSVTPSADFTPDGVALSGNQRRLGEYLQRSWDLGGTMALAPTFGHLSSREDGDDYRADLDSYSAAWFTTSAIQRSLASSAALSSTLSCPVFDGDRTLLDEANCVWGKITAGTNRQSRSADAPGYRVESVDYRVGAQKEVADGWFVGATVGYDSIASSGDDASSDGRAGDLGLALKRVMGPWQLAAGLNLGYGDFDDTRVVQDGTSLVSLNSDYDVTTLGGRLRAAYQIPFDRWYFRPYADLDIVHTHVPGHSETGSDGLALDVEEQDQTVLAFTPSIEVAGRFDLPDRFVMRPYATLGVSLLSEDEWTVDARLQGAPAGAGSFSSDTSTPNLLGNLLVGLQVFQVQGWELNLQYSLQTGDDYVGQSVSGRAAYRF